MTKSKPGAWGGATLHRAVSRVVEVHEDERCNLLCGFAAFLCLLACYFTLLPLRDEAAIALGTANLPKLFFGSLVTTLVAAPLAGGILSSPKIPRHSGILWLYRFLAMNLLAIYLLYELLPAPHYPTRGEAHKTDSRLKLPGMGTAGTALRVGFYLWLGLLNLLAVSSLWARLADVYSPEAASRLFGFLGAGATLGQLVGSVVSAAWSQAEADMHARIAIRAGVEEGVRGMHGPPCKLMLVAACFLEGAAQLASRIRAPPSEKPAGFGSAVSLSVSSSTASLSALDGGGGGGAEAGAAGGGGGAGAGREERAGGGILPPKASSVVSRLWEGFTLIARSNYLLHLCAHLWLTAVVSSFFYFEKSVIVASKVWDPAARTALLAKINSSTALFIALLQLTATGRVIRFAGVPVVLCITPLVAAVMMANLSLNPAPAMVAVAEVLRKVSTYVLMRPAREVLFTVVSREEKYKAKLCIDTLVQRIGDSAAAFAFHHMGNNSFGPSGVAAACLPVCLAWAVVAFRLGRKQQVLARRQQLQSRLEPAPPPDEGTSK